MKTLVAAVLAVFLTVSFAQPAHAGLSSGDRDKLAIAVGLAWLFSQGSSNHDGDLIDLRENCQYSWDKQKCNVRKGLVIRWETYTKQYIEKSNDYFSQVAKHEAAAAKLAELEVYAQKGLTQTQRQEQRLANEELRRSKILMENHMRIMTNLGRMMQDVLVQYGRHGGNKERMKEYAQQYQDQYEDFDPTIAPWEQ